ncbi:MAG: flagellar basal body P-ring protein FlgI [Sedimentisphaerales bacterium]|nr:flagellar basal body P-ring protein FlgI [Sedimentisphaerales bacterium]
MKQQLSYIATLMLLLAAMLIGCNPQEQKTPPPPISGKITLFAEVAAFTPVPVQGYGLVAGLEGTGSTQCPPQIRSYLRQYILAQLPGNCPLTPDQLIDSPDTAVVRINGVMPAAATKGEKFDLQITPVPGTKTTSLAGGRLYTANLMFSAGSKIIGTAQGSVFLDTLGEPQPTTGYVLGGGSANDTYDLALALYKPDFQTANSIRNRISEQFGGSTVTAASAGVIQIKIPPRYAQQKSRFVALLKELYLNENPQQEALRTEQLIKDLGDNTKGAIAEISLEAIGRTQEAKITAALASSDPQTRFRAARCLLFIANDQGLGELRNASIDPASPYRLEAIETIAIGAKRNDAVTILKQFLVNSDIAVRLAAYEQLRRLDDSAIKTIRVADDFEIDQVFCSGTKLIYAYRSGSPRIVIFGAPLIANPNIFIESADGTVFLNSPAENKYVSVVRRYPQRNITIGPIKSSFEITDIIRTLAELPANETKKHAHRGLGLSYAGTIAILNTMCVKGAIRADFVAGPLAKFKTAPSPNPPKNPPTNVMESPPKDR